MILISIFFMVILAQSYATDIYLTVREANDTILHLPPNLEDNPAILLALHGMGPNYPDLFQHETAFDQVADETGQFVVVYPLGSVCIGSAGLCGHTWNGGSCCFSLEEDDTFLLHVILAVQSYLETPAPVVVAGFSAGGVMAHRMACQHSELIAAAVSVSGPLEVDCSPALAVPVLHVHGTLDAVFPWYGAIFHGVPYTVDKWKVVDGCEGEGVEEVLALGIHLTTWECHNGTEVGLVRIDGGGHSWPPSRMVPEVTMWNWMAKWIR